MIGRRAAALDDHQRSFAVVSTSSRREIIRKGAPHGPVEKIHPYHPPGALADTWILSREIGPADGRGP